MIQQKNKSNFKFNPVHANIFRMQNLKEFFLPALGFVAFQFSVGFPIVFCGILIGYIGDSLSLAIFGMSSMFYNLFYLSVLNAVTENLGVLCSKSFAASQYQKVAGYLTKALFYVFVLNLLFLFLAYKGYDLLRALHVDDEVAYFTCQMLVYSLPYIFVQGINNTLVSYLASQGISGPFIYINSFSIVVVLICAPIFINILGYKHIGFVLTKIVQETLTFLFYVYLLYSMAHKETRLFPNFKLLLDDFKNYNILLGKTVACYYGEYLGFEATIYYAALLHNVADLALYCSYVNYTNFFWLINFGVSNAFRTLIGHKIGAGKIRKAKILSQHYFVYTGFLAVILIYLTLIFKYELGYAYTGDKILAYKLADIIVLFAFNIYSCLSFNGMCSILRLLGYDNLLLVATTIKYPLMISIMSYGFCFILGLSVYGICVGAIFSKVIIFWYILWKLYFGVEWKRPLDDSNGEIYAEQLVG